MKVVVTPNSKIPIRGLLSHPFVDEKVLDLTEMQIKRVLSFDAKVHVVSLDGIKGEITLVNGQLNTDAIKTVLESTDEIDHHTDSKTVEVAKPTGTEEAAVEGNNTPVNENTYQHMTKAQRRAARRAAEAQQKAEESAKVEEAAVETVEESNNVDEDAAKDNAEVIEAEEKVEE